MLDSEFGLMRDFASAIALDHLPSGSRVACVGFGTYPVEFFNFETYKDLNTNPAVYVNIPDDASGSYYANLINSQAMYHRGATNLGKAIQAIVHGNPTFEINTPIIDQESIDNRKTILIIMTDGIATDLLGPHLPDLFATNTKTVVVGIGPSFVPNYMEQLVENPVDDIKHVNDFDELNDFIDDIADYTCTSDVSIAVTEFKSTGANKFIEVINLGRVMQTQELKIVSNLVPDGSYALPESARRSLSDTVIGTQDVVVFHESGVLVPYCEIQSSCHPFEVAGSWPDHASDWELRFQQVMVAGTTNQQEIAVDIDSATLLSTDMTNLVTLFSDAYTYEMKISPQAKSGTYSDWRQSCLLNGSPGNATVQFYDCTNRCEIPDGGETDMCGPGGVCEIQDDNQLGCTCSPEGYKTKIDRCELIEAVPQCTIEGTMPVGVEASLTSTDTFQATVVYTLPSDRTIPGYKFTFGDGLNLDDFQGGAPQYTVTARYYDFSSFFIASVGDHFCMEFTKPGTQETGLSCSVQSISHVLQCTNNLVQQDTFEPTVMPSELPSLAPSYSQPTVTVFLSEWADPGMHSLDDEGRRYFKEVQRTSLESVSVSLRVYSTPSDNTTLVRYALYEVVNETYSYEVQSGSWEFPPNALYVADTKEIEFQVDMVDDNGETISERHLRFMILPCPEDDLDEYGRVKYTISEPSSGDIIYVYEAPLVTSETEKESFPWWMYPAIIGGCLLVIIIASYIVCKQRQARNTADERRKDAEEDVRRAEDGFFEGLDVVTENKLGEIKLRHKQKDTVTLTDNVQMITFDDDEKFDMRTNDNFEKQVTYTTTTGYSGGDGSRIPHRKVTSDNDPALVMVTGSAAPEEGNYSAVTPDNRRLPDVQNENLGGSGMLSRSNRDSHSPRFSETHSVSAYEIEEGSLPAAFNE